MKKVVKIFLFVFFAVSMIFSCKKDKSTEQTQDLGYNYFPDDVGSYVIYEVDSIAYDDQAHTPDTIHYLLKEIIADTFLDNTGRTTLRIERFYKMYNDTIPYESMNWIGPKVWTANKTQTTIEKKEENITYLKLIFPVKEGKLWNGNVYNSLGEKEYEMISVDEEETINNFYFDSVLSVKQFEEINIVKYQIETEKYARNAGLVFKQYDSLSFQPKDTSDFPPYDDTVGYTFIQKIKSYGK